MIPASTVLPPIKVYTQLLEQVRAQAFQRLGEHAKSLGANAVVSIGFDTSEMGVR